MMWIGGVPATQVLDAYVAAVTATLIFAYFAARQQHALQPILKENPAGAHFEVARLGIVAIILVSAIGANVFFNLTNPEVLNHFPVIGTAVWLAMILTAAWRRPTWSLLPDALRGSIFLLALVMCAAMMPVQHLPAASWQTAFGLGFVSAVFDNIPLTALALRQGGYDWGSLAYAVGFGGSMIWFGSSAGVALSNIYPQARSVGAWLRGGWHVTVGYVVGYMVLLATLGWHPDAYQRGGQPAATPASVSQPAGTAKH
jgi:Na+/H+ antiporter NhaD/arsenite permease-like protein